MLSWFVNWNAVGAHPFPSFSCFESRHMDGTSRKASLRTSKINILNTRPALVYLLQGCKPRKKQEKIFNQIIQSSAKSSHYLERQGQLQAGFMVEASTRLNMDTTSSKLMV